MCKVKMWAEIDPVFQGLVLEDLGFKEHDYRVDPDYEDDPHASEAYRAAIAELKLAAKRKRKP